MAVRCCLINIFVLMINKVSLEITVQYFVGESAILPCSYTEDKKQVDKVFWRHNDNKKVYEFSPSRISQEVKYDTRAESFPEEYERGNYSIKITNLEKTDAGAYSCFITPAYHNENMHLIIKAAEKPSQTLIEENQRTQMSSGIIAGIIIAILIIVISPCFVVSAQKTVVDFQVTLKNCKNVFAFTYQLFKPNGMDKQMMMAHLLGLNSLS